MKRANLEVTGLIRQRLESPQKIQRRVGRIYGGERASAHRLSRSGPYLEGESDKPDGLYSTELFADDVAAFMQGGIPNAHLSGLSLDANC
jgi:hypothetical protein